MSRLEKKCFVASAGAHIALVAAVFVSAAWVTDEKPKSYPKLTFIPSRILDGVIGGGGSPNAGAQSRPVQPPQRQPDRAPRLEQQQAAAKPVPKPIVAPKSSTMAQKRPSPADKIDVNLEVKRGPKSKPTAKSTRSKSTATGAKWDAQLARIQENLTDGLSSGTTIGPLGPGGEAYAGYTQVVLSIYDDAWFPPEEASDDSSIASARITIRRNGTIVSDPITKRSGNSAVDKSVREALERVRARGLPPFPEGARDNERSITIHFNLRAKRQIG